MIHAQHEGLATRSKSENLSSRLMDYLHGDMDFPSKDWNKLTGAARTGAIALFCLFVTIFHGMALSAETNEFHDLRRGPDAISIVTETGASDLESVTKRSWHGGGVDVITHAQRNGLRVEMIAPGVAVKQMRLRWKATMPRDGKYLGDAWERAYGDLGWKPLDGSRTMPWYFLASDGKMTHGYGVKTGPSALCYWTADESNITLHADVRCGGMGVQLGHRKLDVCTVVCRRGQLDETPFAAAQAFCREMCPSPRMPKEPVYGFNDWYCTYGHDTAAEFLANVEYIASLIPQGGNRPFAVVDDGWQGEGKNGESPGLWSAVNPNFSKTLTMTAFAKQIHLRGAQPGLWCRPLIADTDTPESWRLSRDPHFLDPTVPEVRAHVRETISRFRKWGYKLIKHDYSTYDLFGRWGFQMGNEVTPDGWAFADRSLTTAEVIRRFYEDIRQAAGPRTLILGCNTIGHLSAGIFELQRIGDDTSGREWDRTRKMGVNSLAFRAPQDGSFFAVDADCAGQVSSNSVPWEKNSQWLDLLAHSGTPLFVSFPHNSVTLEQERALRAALIAGSHPQPLAEPLDWQTQRAPTHWILDGKEKYFSW
jgi:alpha-galactosidase